MTDFSPSPEGPVLMVGASGMDMVGRLKGEMHMGTSNPAQIRRAFGGVARNIAENLARLGQPVILLSAVGSDDYGERLLKQASAAGIDVSAVVQIPERPTSTYLAVVNEKGELQFALDDMRATSAITPAYLHAHADLFKEASLLFIDANLSKEALRTAVSLARKARIPIGADPTSTLLAHKLRPHLPRLRLIVPNSSEAGILCDRQVDASKRRQTLEAAKCLVSQGVGIVILTLAQFGVCYATSHTSGYIPAIRTEILDPTGGGDALIAAVIFGLLNGMSLDEAIRLGVSAATLTLRHPGAVLPDLTLEKLYDQLVI
ncbi:MAG: carbohydrate kinase family protein [Chloroflexota bacterium]